MITFPICVEHPVVMLISSAQSVCVNEVTPACSGRDGYVQLMCATPAAARHDPEVCREFCRVKRRQPCSNYQADLASQNVRLDLAFCRRFNDGALTPARYRRWPSWAELRRLLPICVNEMTPVCRQVTVIFTESVIAAQVHASLWRSLTSFA